MTPSEWIRQLRHRFKLTQAELAERLGVQQSTVGRLESGKHSPRVATLERIARKLGVRAEVTLSPQGLRLNPAELLLPEA